MTATRTSNRIRGRGRGIGPLGTTARVLVGGVLVAGVTWGHLTSGFHLSAWLLGLVGFPAVVLAGRSIVQSSRSSMSRTAPHYPATLALVQGVLAELAIAAEVRTTLIGDQAAAEQARFSGSPTVTPPGGGGDGQRSSAQQRRCAVSQPVAVADYRSAGADRPGRVLGPPGRAVEQQEEVVVQATEIDPEPVQEPLADHVAGIPQVGHPTVDHVCTVDLGAGVERPPLDPDHIDPQPGVRVPLEDVLGRPPGARKALPSGGGQGQHQPRHALVVVEPHLQLAEVV
jgi:hypothetical protein